MKQSRILVIALAVVIAGCGPGHNYHQASIYGAAIDSVLISHKLCKDEQDCIRKEMIFAEGGTFTSSPVHVNVYNISNPTVARAIVEAARAARPSATVGVKLRITASKHLDTPYKSVHRASIE